MIIKKLTLMAAVAMCSLHLSAQETEQERRINLGLEYTTELQTNFRAANWVNLLQLEVGLQLGRGVAIEAKSLSIAKTHEKRLINDLQVFSNIEEADLPFALAVLGIGWEKEWDGTHSNQWKDKEDAAQARTELFFGIRNVNEDYFTSPCTSLFTNSSCGIFPTISANYDIANYPLASVCINFKQHWRDCFFQASIYNGQGYNGFKKSDNPFLFRPAKDGVFGIAAVNYDQSESHYELGSAVYIFGNQAIFTPWLNIEQRLTTHLHLLVQGSMNFATAPECKDYEALGIIAVFGRTETGLIFNHATFSETHEWATELTCKILLTKNISLQPTIHLIRTGSITNTAALLRLSYAL